MYDLQWILEIKDISNLLNEEEMKELYEKIFKLLFYIKDEIILNQKSIPSGSFKKLMEESPRDENGAIHIPYINYKINKEVYEYVLDYHFKKHRLDESSRSKLRVSIAMGPSPSYI